MGLLRRNTRRPGTNSPCAIAAIGFACSLGGVHRLPPSRAYSQGACQVPRACLERERVWFGAGSSTPRSSHPRGGPDADTESFFLDVPAAAIEALLEHLKRYVPPRLATIEDITGDSGLVTVLGPEAVDTIARIVLGTASLAAEVESLAEGEFLEIQEDENRGDRDTAQSTVVNGTVRIARTCDVDVPAWDLFLSAGRFRGVWESLIEAGAAPIGAGVWDTLRVEAGRPAYGADMDESTILSETGLVDRAVDHTKGCYTGQEVIVRIRDRGHVNRSLRGLLLAEGPPVKPGSELYREDRVVGKITSVVESPLRNGPIGLGYVHRDVSNGEQVTVGSSAGPPAGIRALGPGWTSQ